MTAEQEKFLLNVKVGKYLAEMKHTLRKHGLTQKMVIAFPKKKKVPFWGKIAVWLIRRNGGVLDTTFKHNQ